MNFNTLNDSEFTLQNSINIITRIKKINKINLNFFLASILILYFITLHGVIYIISEPIAKKEHKEEQNHKKFKGK